MAKKSNKSKSGHPGTGWFRRRDAAAFLGLTLQQFERRYQSLVGEADTHRDEKGHIWLRGRAVVDVYAQSLAGRTDSNDDILQGQSTPALERLREANAKLAELQLRERLQQTIPRDLIRSGFGNVASILRRCGETIQRQFGREALVIFNEALDECDQAVGNGIFGEHGSDNRDQPTGGA